VVARRVASSGTAGPAHSIVKRFTAHEWPLNAPGMH